jgi:hypothetical protein
MKHDLGNVFNGIDVDLVANWSKEHLILEHLTAVRVEVADIINITHPFD